MISTAIARGVQLGGGLYLNSVVITGSGLVTAEGDATVLSTQAGGQLINYGYVSAGLGSNDAGGIGVDFKAAGTIKNAGYIKGGQGYFGPHDLQGGNGGDSVYLKGGTLDNLGTIMGGAGVGTGYFGGSGVRALGGAAVTNESSGTIKGGQGTYGAAGGAGLSLFSSAKGYNLTGSTLQGGASQYGYGGAGAQLDHSTLNNDAGGIVRGGDTASSSTSNANGLGGRAGGGVSMNYGTLTNQGKIYGGNNVGYGEHDVFYTPLVTLGGYGVRLNGTLTNAGTIVGGTATATGTGSIGLGGVGVINLGQVSNSGTIRGGASNGIGGTGVFEDTSSFINTGSILGGYGTSTGGIGVYLFGTMSTSGLISGGKNDAGTYAASVQFHGSNSTLTVKAGASFTGAITDFVSGDRIDLTDVSVSQAKSDFNAGTETLTTGVDGTLQFSGTFAPNQFQFTSDGGTGTYVTLVKESVISTAITSEVDVGTGVYLSPLVITSSGSVHPHYALDAVKSRTAGGQLTNYGTLTAGKGYSTGSGGQGVYLNSGGLNNLGTITGGAGYRANQSGGAGAYLKAGDVFNYSPPTSGTSGAHTNLSSGSGSGLATITGGAGMEGAAGGAGLSLFSSAKGYNLTGSTLQGGASQYGYGGAGAQLDHSTLNNDAGGIVRGGDTASSSTSNANGLGGRAGGGVSMNYGTLTNQGKIYGGNNVGYGEHDVFYTPLVTLGGYGVRLNGTLTNAGTIVGGTATATGTGSIGLGGVGVINLGQVSNSGTIRGGASNGIGGTGVFEDTSSFINTGSILGGNGTSTGGIGVYLFGTMSTSGLISGGKNDAGTYAASVQFHGSNSTLTVKAGASFTGAITDFVSGDRIDLTDVSVSQAKSDFNAGTETLTTGVDGTLQFSGTFAPNQFQFTSDGGTGTYVTLVKESVISTAVNAPQSLTNANLAVLATGSIRPPNNAGEIGVNLNGGILTNAGLISGSRDRLGYEDAVKFGANASTLIVEPGAVFHGGVVANGVNDTLKLAGNVDPTLTGFGTQFTGFTTLEFGDGASWTVDATAASLKSPLTITGFDTADTIDVTDLSFVTGATANFNASNDILTVTDGGTTLAVQFQGDFTGENFLFTADAAGTGSEISVAACFLSGTRIRSENGDVDIDALTIGDRVMTLSGVSRPIRWIGRRSYSRAFATGNRDILPIRFAAGSLGECMPVRDLWVSPEHAMWIDGMLIPARVLVNGKSIVQDDRVQDIQYVHVELATHDVIFAEGAPSESYADDERRERFDNVAEYWALYPDRGTVHAPFCAPRIEEGFELERVRQKTMRLTARGVRI